MDVGKIEFNPNTRSCGGGGSAVGQAHIVWDGLMADNLALTQKWIGMIAGHINNLDEHLLLSMKRMPETLEELRIVLSQKVD
jgi:hypothetical protein